MAKKLIILTAGVLVMGLAVTGLSQRAGRGGKVQAVIVQEADRTFTRGWMKKDRGKSVFIDTKGKTSTLSQEAKVFTISQMERDLKKYQQNLLMQDMKEFERLTKILDWARSHRLYEAMVEYGEKFKRLNLANPNPEIEDMLKEAKEKLAELKSPPGEGGGSQWTMEDVQKVRFAFLPIKGPVEALPVVFKKNVLRRFLEEMGKSGKYVTVEEQRRFNSLRPAEKAQRIKLETGDKFQEDIVIGKDPQGIMEFRRVAEPMLARSCANPNCHGGGTLQFKLIARAGALPDIYANFYSLDTFRSQNGDVINHDEPEKSLLLNYLLPADLAADKLSHPTQIPPMIKSKRDPRYTQMVNWLKSLPPQPIDEATGQEVATTQPAEAAAPPAETSEKPAKPKPSRAK